MVNGGGDSDLTELFRTIIAKMDEQVRELRVVVPRGLATLSLSCCAEGDGSCAGSRPLRGCLEGSTITDIC